MARAADRSDRGHHLQGVLRVGETCNTLRAAGAGEDADLDFRQADLDRLGVRGHAAMAGERQLGRATHAGAVDGGDPGLAVGLDLAPEPGHATGGVEELLDGGGRVLGLLLFEHGEHALDHGEIGAAREGRLAGGEDHALDAVVGNGLVEDLLDLVHHFHGEDVHRLVGHVPGDEGNAVCVGLDGEVLVSHILLLPEIRRVR